MLAQGAAAANSEGGSGAPGGASLSTLCRGIAAVSSDPLRRLSQLGGARLETEIWKSSSGPSSAKFT